MNIRELRKSMGLTQSEFAQRYKIPFRTIQNWEGGSRHAPEYVLNMLENIVKTDLINRKTVVLPKYSRNKIDLPKRSDYGGAISWLQAVQDELDEKIVFALDEALMCQGNFGGRSDEFLIWAYGSDNLSRFNGIVVLGNWISEYDVMESNGLCFTNLNRTINDALANESILDMQGITEALSKYYFMNGESFNGLFVAPAYQKQFDKLAKEAVEYYEY